MCAYFKWKILHINSYEKYPFISQIVYFEKNNIYVTLIKNYYISFDKLE